MSDCDDASAAARDQSGDIVLDQLAAERHEGGSPLTRNQESAVDNLV
jgi:hypothetical protein